MTFPELLLLAAVLSLLPVTRRNLTALALVASYVTYEAAWWLFGVTFPPLVCILIDITVIGAIYCKEPDRDCWPYQGWKHQLCSAWLERAFWDRIVIAIFPAMWAVYVLPLPANVAWWALWGFAMGQYLAISGEALQIYFHTRSAKAGSSASTGAQFTAGWETVGYG